MLIPHGWFRPFLFAAIALTLAFAAASCGDDDDGSEGTGASQTQTAASGEQDPGPASGGAPSSGVAAGGAQGAGDAATGTSASAPPAAGPNTGPILDGDIPRPKPSKRVEARRAKAALARIYAALRDSNMVAVCETMTAAAQKQVAESGPEKGMDCEQALARYYAYAKRDGGLAEGLSGRVIGAKVAGDTATVRVRFARTGDVTTVELVKDGGRWKLPARL